MKADSTLLQRTFSRTRAKDSRTRATARRRRRSRAGPSYAACALRFEAQQPTLSSQQVVKQVGHALLRVALPDGNTETYLITLPKLKIEGLWFGMPYVELRCVHSGSQPRSILRVSSADHFPAITRTSKLRTASRPRSTTPAKVRTALLASCVLTNVSTGYFSGKSHTFSATIGPGPSSASPLYTIEGTWTATSNFVKPSKGGKEGQLFLNAAMERTPITVKDLAEQNEFESRKVWKDTADGIRRGASSLSRFWSGADA